jgi:type II secretory pathway component PulF
MGFVPISIALETRPALALPPGLIKGREKVKPQHLVSFTRQFATIIKAGVPILTGLSALSEQTESSALKGTLTTIAKDVEGGSSLSQALDKHPAIFSELYVNSILAGEAGGVLDKVLLRLAEMLERDAETNANIKAALRYPAMTMIAMVLACLFLVIFVIPNFAGIYARFEAQLPLPTRILIGLNQVITHYWYIIVPVVVALGYTFSRYINTKRGRWQWDNLKLRLPVFGGLFLKVYMLRFVSMLDTLNESGLPILRTLEIVSTTLGNVVIAREVDLMRHSVADGHGIAGSIMESKIFPPLVAHMISIGEKTGALGDMLRAIENYYDLELRTTVKNLTSMIEPIMTAILAAVVLGIALAIFLPMWNMIQLFRK